MKELPTTSLINTDVFLCTNLGVWVWNIHLLFMCHIYIYTSCCLLALTLYIYHFLSTPKLPIGCSFEGLTHTWHVFLLKVNPLPPLGSHFDYLLLSLHITLHNSLIMFYKIMYYMSMNHSFIMGSSIHEEQSNYHVNLSTCNSILS